MSIDFRSVSSSDTSPSAFSPLDLFVKPSDLRFHSASAVACDMATHGFSQRKIKRKYEGYLLTQTAKLLSRLPIAFPLLRHLPTERRHPTQDRVLKRKGEKHRSEYQLIDCTGKGPDVARSCWRGCRVRRADDAFEHEFGGTYCCRGAGRAGMLIDDDG